MQQQGEQQSFASHPLSTQTPAASAAEERDEEPATVLEQLRPQLVADASIAAIIRETPPPTLQPEPASEADRSFSSAAADSPPLALASHAEPDSFPPASSPPLRESWREELDALDAAALDEDDEEMQRYMTAPLSAPPSFDEMQAEIDSLLRIEIRGRAMFPLYMRDRLRLLCLGHMHRVITALLASAAPYTEHDLHSRLFSHLVKHAAKLARSDDERISILCPDAPMLGAKVPHPQWPELATVMRRYFTTASKASLEMDFGEESDAVTSGRIRLSDLFSGLDSGPTEAAADGDEIVFDLDSIDEEAVSRDMDAEDAQRDATAPSRQEMSSSQRTMFDMQREAREQAKELMGRRLRALKKKRQHYLRQQAEAAAADGRGGSRGAVVRGEQLKRRQQQRAESEEEGEDDPLSLTHNGAPRMLAVVYRFDSGDEFEMRYPLSRKDIKRLQLFQEDDGKDDIVIK